MQLQKSSTGVISCCTHRPEALTTIITKFFVCLLNETDSIIGFATNDTSQEDQTYPRSFTVASFKWIYVSGKMP